MDLVGGGGQAGVGDVAVACAVGGPGGVDLGEVGADGTGCDVVVVADGAAEGVDGVHVVQQVEGRGAGALGQCFPDALGPQVVGLDGAGRDDYRQSAIGVAQDVDEGGGIGGDQLGVAGEGGGAVLGAQFSHEVSDDPGGLGVDERSGVGERLDGDVDDGGSAVGGDRRDRCAPCRAGVVLAQLQPDRVLGTVGAIGDLVDQGHAGFEEVGSRGQRDVAVFAGQPCGDEATNGLEELGCGAGDGEGGAQGERGG